METKLTVTTGTLSESRRKFIEKAGASLLLGTLGVSFFTSCANSEDTNPSPPPSNSGSGIAISGNTISIDLTIQTRLATSGNWLLIDNAKVLVANINNSYVALTSVCTHSGCSDSWTFSNQRFTCTCHGSVFDPGGSVLVGPARDPLTSYRTSLSGTKLTITK
ncbi:cytochrome b6-f complex iron-sulfur subunit [Algoriphagus boseongensis]|uniref:Cytochrome b6-f complex iron-sulfur subunit n=1 Tax=Algoriphagus boseongensis TaxID=1442587 RepID=A0A4R6TBR3_9BACT|nr:Rieske (2Fe-2S) protein [Algoriphagus boseongensis]TDQ18904.1 cytochrome b6-f complex iron-sulfur subunit [Algoriphagus boseongensis]